MFENKYGKFITVILVLMVILIIGILIFLGVKVIGSFKLAEEGKDAAEKFENQFLNNNQVGDKTNTQANEQVNDVAPDVKPENDIFGGDASNPTEQTYKGFKVVGSIEIPKTNLKSLVLEKASSKAIEVAVGVYSGVGLNKVGNTVIAGHNYRNGTFFSDNKKLTEGDKVYITDSTGKKVAYNIYKVYTTSPQDSEHINRDTQGKMEITLTTCTDDTKSRLIIWASAE